MSLNRNYRFVLFRLFVPYRCTPESGTIQHPAVHCPFLRAPAVTPSALYPHMQPISTPGSRRQILQLAAHRAPVCFRAAQARWSPTARSPDIYLPSLHGVLFIVSAFDSSWRCFDYFACLRSLPSPILRSSSVSQLLRVQRYENLYSPCNGSKYHTIKKRQKGYEIA